MRLVVLFTVVLFTELAGAQPSSNCAAGRTCNVSSVNVTRGAGVGVQVKSGVQICLDAPTDSVCIASSGSGNAYVLKAGDTMTGKLTFSGASPQLASSGTGSYIQDSSTNASNTPFGLRDIAGLKVGTADLVRVVGGDGGSQMTLNQAGQLGFAVLTFDGTGTAPTLGQNLFSDATGLHYYVNSTLHWESLQATGGLNTGFAYTSTAGAPQWVCNSNNTCETDSKIGLAESSTVPAGRFKNAGGLKAAGSLLYDWIQSDGGTACSLTEAGTLSCIAGTGTAENTFSAFNNLGTIGANKTFGAFRTTRASTSKTACFTTTVIGVGAAQTELLTLYDVTGAANTTSTLSIPCDAAVNTVTCGDVTNNAAASGNNYGFRFTTDNCTTDPIGNASMTFSIP